MTTKWMAAIDLHSNNLFCAIVDRDGNRLRSLRQQCDALGTRLRLLGPERVLARGYSITMDAATGHVIRNAAETHSSQELKTRLKTGVVNSTVRPESSPEIS